VVIGIKNGEIVYVPFSKATTERKVIDNINIEMVKMLSI
jgi:hypothetical protein